ncbi:hypothetical protein MnTg03_00765 [bacterium MnTg03]|nr:hypothetical protein MnTg03_00765 [bacterium MnTg03]
MALSQLLTKHIKYPMNQFVSIILLSLLVTGCATGSGDVDPYVKQLQWLDAANPQTDAQQALKKGDFRLLGLATRSVNIPGVSNEESLMYELKCGVQLIDGISDVVRSDEHLRLMQKARSYALKYNAIIKTRCKP